jgi:CBS domain-containing protein
MDNKDLRIKEFGLINKAVLCYINSAIQLLWRIDGVRNFFLETNRNYIQALQPFTKNSAFYRENSSIKDFTKIMNASLVVDGSDENKARIAIEEPIYKNLLEALMTLFKEINTNPKITMNMEKIKIPAGKTVLDCVDDFIKNLMADGGVALQDDVMSIIQKFLHALEYFMNDTIYQIYKEYTFVNNAIKSCGEGVSKRRVASIKSYSPNWIVNMRQIEKDNTKLSDLIEASQEEVEDAPENTYEKCDDIHKYPSHTKYTPALFKESNTVIITMPRATSTITPIIETPIIPDKTLTISEKIYTLQGCIIHLGYHGANDGKMYSYGHYVFYTYDNSGEPKRRISDSTIENITAKYIKEINTRAYVFLYKALSEPATKPAAALKPAAKPGAALKPALKPESVAKPTPESIAQPFIAHAMSRIAELHTKLLADGKFRVAIGGNAENNTHLLGTGFAMKQWHDNMDSKYDKKEVSTAHTLFINTLQTEFEKLRRIFEERVSYKRFDVKDIINADKNYYLVWGANADNWRGKTGEPIEGGGMAQVMKKHKEGIFGIITTPYLPKDEINTPNVLTSIVNYNYIWDMVKSNIPIELKKKSESEQKKYKDDLYRALVLRKYSSATEGLTPESEAKGIILIIRDFLNISETQHREALEQLYETIEDEAIKKQITEDIKKLPVIDEDDGKAADGKAKAEAEADGKEKAKEKAVKADGKAEADGKAAKEKANGKADGKAKAADGEAKAKAKAGEDDKKDEEEDGEAKAKAKAGEDDGEEDEKAEVEAEEVARILIDSFKKSPLLTNAKIVDILNAITREIREPASENTYVKLIDDKITINF